MYFSSPYICTMNRLLIKNGTLVNEGKTYVANLVIENGLIAAVTDDEAGTYDAVIDAQGKWVMPGLIDDQVHFREPGLTHKGEIYTEAKAAVAGGITSYMEMPNTVPNTLTQELLEEKYAIGAARSLANYSFFMGASNNNLDEVLKTDPHTVCGVKVFMGSSTGNMLVDNRAVLEELFSKSQCLIATHCEDEQTIVRNLAHYKAEKGDALDASYHPLIRSHEACYLSSSMAVELAKKHNTRLHILHISTAQETELFSNNIPLAQKRITAEACIHHLWFTDADYARKGNNIKWNPAVKTAADRDAILKAALDGRIDIIATDHAPHTREEKSKPYLDAPSGGPLVQHALLALVQLYHQGKITPAQIVEKTSHNVAEIFRIEKRGYLRPGYFADVVIVDPNEKQTITPESLLYKCGWSPFEGETFTGKVTHTIVNGHIVYADGKFDESKKGMRMTFNPQR